MPHKNTDAKNKLIECLEGMKREGLIDIWHDIEILAGDTWKEEIFSTHLPDSDILLLLVSATSLASKNCNKELGLALKKNIKPIPIILEDCDWLNHLLSDAQSLQAEDEPTNEWKPKTLGDIQALPGEGKPINEWET